MSATIHQVITTADPVPEDRRYRQWLFVGEPFVVAGVMITMLIERGREPWLALHSNSGKHYGDVPMSPLTFGAAPYQVIPRAYRYHANGMAEAVLLEIQYTGSEKPAWQQPKDRNDAQHFQPLPDAG